MRKIKESYIYIYKFGVIQSYELLKFEAPFYSNIKLCLLINQNNMTKYLSLSSLSNILTTTMILFILNIWQSSFGYFPLFLRTTLFAFCWPNSKNISRHFFNLDGRCLNVHVNAKDQSESTRDTKKGHHAVRQIEF